MWNIFDKSKKRLVNTELVSLLYLPNLIWRAQSLPIPNEILIWIFFCCCSIPLLYMKVIASCPLNVIFMSFHIFSISILVCFCRSSFPLNYISSCIMNAGTQARNYSLSMWNKWKKSNCLQIFAMRFPKDFNRCSFIEFLLLQRKIIKSLK